MKKIILALLLMITTPSLIQASSAALNNNSLLTLSTQEKREIFAMQKSDISKIAILEEKQRFLYTIILSCTVISFFQYNSAVGVLIDLINNNPQFWLGALNDYFCPPPPPEPIFYA